MNKKSVKFAVLDIETTGGNPVYHRMTEIAIRIYDGKKLLDSFDTLLNPQRIINPFITRLTGITNEMVKDAPTFEEVADRIDEITKDCVVVAHNVNFDYGFIKGEFRKIDRTFKRKKLCTVRLSRKILPNLYSYSLGKIATQLGYKIENRHRAAGDTDFTLELFKILLEKDTDNHIEEFLNQRTRESLIPPNLDRKKFDLLPESMGLYFFKDRKGKVLYIGKAKNLKNRVAEHFSGNTNTASRNRFTKQIWDLDYKTCENEMIALIEETHAIKKYWPPYNRSLKSISLNFGIYAYHDQGNYLRLASGTTGKHDKPLISFRYNYQARNYLSDLVAKYDLCPKLVGLQEGEGGCDEFFATSKCRITCQKNETSQSYNLRVNLAIENINQEEETYYITEKTLDGESESVVLFEKGRYLGYGFKPKEQKIKSLNDAKALIHSEYDDQDIRGVIQSYVKRKRNRIRVKYLKN